MKKTIQFLKISGALPPYSSSHFFFLSILILTLFLLLFFTASAQAIIPPEAVQGQLDLSAWDFEKNGPVELSGEWSFYWNKLLTPENFKSGDSPPMTGFFNIPGYWNGYQGAGKQLDGEGFASFHLSVKLKQKPQPLALRLEDQATAYRLWANGKLLMSNGRVAQNRQAATAQYLLIIVPVEPVSDNIDLVLQVSNFHLHRGGPYRSISLGIEPQIRIKQQLLWAVDLITLAILVAIGLHHVVFYLLRRKEPAPLYFGLFCVLWGIHIPFWGAGGKFITVLFPHFNWGIAHKLDLLTWYPTVPLILMFIDALFPKEIPIKIVRSYQAVAALFLLIVLITPPRIAGYTVLPYELYALITIPPVGWIPYRAVKGKREGSGLVVFGFILFLITAINDILYNMSLIYSANLIPCGVGGVNPVPVV